GLNENDQDSLNAAAGGNLLSKTTREALNIIENKLKVCYSRNKSNVSRMNTTSRESVSKTNERIDKLADQLSILVEIVSKKVITPALVKAVEEICVTCSGPHAWYNCPNTNNNQASVYATTGSYNQGNPQNRVSNQMAPPGFAPVQNNGQNLYNNNQGQGNNFNRGNNFHGNQDITLLEEFADELNSLFFNPFPLVNEDVLIVECKLREIELLLNHDPSINFSPTFTIDPNPKKFTDEPAPACLPPLGDDESFLKEDMLEDVERKDSNVSNFDEPILLNTPLFDKDKCFDPGGDNDGIDAFLAIEVSTNIEEGYYDSEGDVFYLEKFLIDDTTLNLFPEVLFDHEPQCFKDESEFDTLKNMVKVFDPEIWEKTFSPSCVRLSSKDHHYLFFTIVVQILFTHHVNFLFSFGEKKPYFDARTSAFHFSS
ncbi:hypothetical protein Tco_0747078, partial [Tanacetum coccineum]